MEISFEQVAYVYQPNTPLEYKALKDINVTIKDKSFTALIGHTGSGKSTFVQHINALLKPTEGTIKVGDKIITSETTNKSLKEFRRQIGMVFQFPESQLFEETVERDIMFGPLNFGFSEEEAKKSARETIKKVGLDESFLELSPFDLSGGQMRRVAIAGVLASNPDVLILDEPTAGLDPQGRKEIMELFYKLHTEGKTIILVTHQMDDVIKYADNVIVFNNSEIAKTGKPSEIFSDEQWIKENRLELPKTIGFLNLLKKKGINTDEIPLNIDELVSIIKKNI